LLEFDMRPICPVHETWDAPVLPSFRRALLHRFERSNPANRAVISRQSCSFKRAAATSDDGRLPEKSRLAVLLGRPTRIGSSQLHRQDGSTDRFDRFAPPIATASAMVTAVSFEAFSAATKANAASCRFSCIRPYPCCSKQSSRRCRRDCTCSFWHQTKVHRGVRVGKTGCQFGILENGATDAFGDCPRYRRALGLRTWPGRKDWRFEGCSLPNNPAAGGRDLNECLSKVAAIHVLLLL
jgi:hypothetical protein